MIHKLITWFRNDYFKKNFIIYALIAFFAVFSAPVFLLPMVNNLFLKSTFESQRVFLNQLSSMSDSYILSQVEKISSLYFMDIRKNEQWLNFFGETGSLDGVDAVNLYKELGNIQINNAFIDNITVYNFGREVVISSISGVIHTKVWENKIRDMDIGLMRSFIRSGINREWLPPREVENERGIGHVITYIQAVPLIPASAEKTGCITIKIDTEKFLSYINANNRENLDIIILDSSGKAFAHTNSEKLYDDYTWLVDLIASNGENKESVIIDNQSISWAESSMNEWHYVSLMPIQSLKKDIFEINRIAVYTTFIVLLLVIFCVHYATTILQRPIISLIATIREQFNHNQPLGEIGTIEDAISDISLRLHNAEEIVKENNSLIANQIITDMISGNAADIDEVRSRFALIGVDYNYNNFIMFYTQVSLKKISGLSMRERELVWYKLIDVTNSFFNKLGHCSSIRYGSDSVLHILATDDKVNVRSFSVLKDAFLKILGLKVNVVVFEQADNIAHVWEQYKTIDTVKKYSFIYGYDNIFRYEDIKKYETNSPETPFDAYKNIENSLKLSKTDTVKEEIKGVIANIKNFGYSHQYAQSTLVHIVSILFRVMREQRVRVENIEEKLTLLNSAETVDEFYVLILELLEKYNYDLKQRNANIDLDFMDSILEYIENNIDSDLTLKSAADHFKMNNTYLSKLFKKQTGVNFAVYIQEAKFKKAAEMIVSDKKMSITDIAGRLGYYNMTYFTRKFKERYGVTPVQYRKTHVSN